MVSEPLRKEKKLCGVPRLGQEQQNRRAKTSRYERFFHEDEQDIV